MRNIMYILAFFIIFVPMIHAQDTMKVRSGWNMVGARSTRALSEFTSEPPGIIISNYFGYSSGYTRKDTLIGGEGYWVKAIEAGLLIGGATSGFVCGTSTVEYEGKTYNTVQIGTQCWFKENLNVGTMIAGIINQTNNSINEKYCYNDSTENCNTYGGLYQWNEAMQYSTTAGAQGLCPSGWHIPNEVEFQTLAATVNNSGNTLKAVGQGTGGGAGTNASGFSALLSGYWDNAGYFVYLGSTAVFWSSTENYGVGSNANLLGLSYFDDDIAFTSIVKNYGLSIRCLKD